MKSMIGKVGLVVLTAILVSSVFAASGTAVSASPVEVWNVTWDGSRFDKGCAVATSGDSVYMAGTSTIVDDSHTNLTSALTTPTAFLNKYDKDGNFVWNVLYEENSTGIDVSAVATAGDSVYMAGTVSSTVTGNVTGYFQNITEDAFLNKYNSDGNIIWNITWGGGPGTYSANAVATSGDYVYLAGNMMPLLSSNASSSNFLNKYDSDGNLIWNVTWAQMDYEREAKVAAISGGCVYLAGETVDLCAFLVKYDGDGNLILSRNVTCGGGVEAIATGDNAVYLAGNGPHGAFLNKYDSVGNFIWNTTWGEWPTQGSAIATSGNSVYLTGFDIVGTNIFHYIFLNKYNSADGKLIWNVTWGGTSATGGGATAMTEDGVYLAGTIWRDPYTPGTDTFLVKFSESALTPTPAQTMTPTTTPVGAQPVEVWNITWGGTDFAEGYAIAATGDNAMYLAGAIDFKAAFLNKYNSTDGKLIWNVTRGGSGKAIATGDNAVYLAGHTPDWKAFLNKYDNGGNLIWNVTLGILGTLEVGGSAVATSGDSVYMAGSAISNSTGDVEGFLNRYDSDGNLIWNRTLETGGVAASASASGDSVYIVGSALLYKAFLDKYDSDGNLIWNRTWGGEGKATATGDNAVYVAGTTPVSPCTFLNKYDDDGNLIWHITCRGKGNSVATRDNAVYLAGTTAPGVFLNKYSSTDGNLIWGIIRGGKDTSDGMTAITGDSVYLAGSNVYNISLAKFSDPAPTPAPIASPASAAPAVPGFEAMSTIVGLLAVAYLAMVMVRRK